MNLLSFLSVATGASIPTIERIISSAPKRYKVYQIPKRSGGLRTIAHPAKELKALQRVILHEILDNVEVSPIATAYVKGRGILFNAEKHAKQKWLLKLDFKDFFPSLKPKDWTRTLNRFDSLKKCKADNVEYQRLLFWGNGGILPECLSIGAPTSPSVSNLICFRLDLWMIEHANRLGLVVTRYADDITVSGPDPRALLQFEMELHRALSASSTLRLELNEKKRGIYGPGERRMVTGLILTPEGRVSIGRERKREISSLVHKFKLNLLNENESMKAKGLLGFVNACDAKFFETLLQKYGEHTIHALQRFDGFM